MIYFGATAQSILEKNLTNRKYAKCQGCFPEGNLWIAFDNRNGECYVEEFSTEEKAVCWLEQYFEISEIHTFRVFKLFKGLYFIPNSGFLKIKFIKEMIESKFYSINFLDKG